MGKLLDRQGVFFPYLHLLGGPFGEPSRYSFEERVAAVGRNGGTGMGFDGDEFDSLLATQSADQLKDILAEYGVRIGELQILFGWHFGGEWGERSLGMERHLYELADLFGIKRVKTVIMTPTELPPFDLLVERWAGVCDRAAEHGIEVVFEPQSVNPGFDYAAAVDMLLAAGRPNGGFVVDAWHFFRDSDPYTALDRLPTESIRALELRDARAEPQVSRFEDCLNYNLLPGEGDFDLVGLLRYLDGRDAQPSIAVEVLSTDLRKLSVEDNVTQSLAAVSKVMEAARAQ
jgi:sugar phosphate isomerase/epimerase